MNFFGLKVGFLRAALCFVFVFCFYTGTTEQKVAKAEVPTKGEAKRVEKESSVSQHDWSVVAVEWPEKLYANQEVQIPITIRNDGAFARASSKQDFLAYHWLDSKGQMLVFDGLRSPLHQVLEPGDTMQLIASVRTPPSLGDYILEWGMVREHVRWYPIPKKGARKKLSVGDWQGEWELLEVKSGGESSLEDNLEAWAGGEERTLKVQLKKLGPSSWDPAKQDALSYHWWTVEGEKVLYEGKRTPFPRVVQPGEEVEFELQVTTPKRAGLFRLELEPVREGVRWYGPPTESSGAGSSQLEVEVEGFSFAWGIVEHNTPSKIARDRSQLVSLTLANLGSAAWEEDVFSYHWLDEQGRVLSEGGRTPLDRVVEPGEWIDLEVSLEPPKLADTEKGPGLDELPVNAPLQLKWEPLREGVTWHGASEWHDNEETVELGAPDFSWELVKVVARPIAWVGDTAEFDLKVRNTGKITWSEESKDRLSYRWRDEAGNLVPGAGIRTHFENEVLPGQKARLSARVKIPDSPGKYELEWRLVRENVRWYDPPKTEGTPAHLQSVQVHSILRWFGGCLAALVLFAMAVLEWLRREQSGLSQTLQDKSVWLMFGLLWLVLVSTVYGFAELSGLDLHSGKSWLVFSGVCVYMLPVVLLQGWKQRLLAAILVLGLAVLTIADLLYMHFFGSIVPVVALVATHHAADVGSSIVAEFHSDYWWIFVGPVSASVFFMWGMRVPSQAASEEERKLSAGRGTGYKSGRWAPALLCCLAAAPFILRASEELEGSLGRRVFSEQRNTQRFGFLNVHLFDLARETRDFLRSDELTSHEVREVQSYMEKRRRENLSARASPGYANSNVLFIQVEAMQGFMIGAEVNGQEVMPFLNRLSEQAMYFPNIADQTAQGQTSDAEYMALTGNHPMSRGALAFLRADRDFYTLAHHLQKEGYSTFSSHPYHRGFWNRAQLHPKYGFERSLFRRELGPGLKVGWGLADGLFFERVGQEIKKQAKPWFAFAVTLSLHHPYKTFPERLKQLDFGELEGPGVGNYLHGMNYLDRSLKALFEQLDQSGQLEHTIVVIYGDHGARFSFRKHPELLALAGQKNWKPHMERVFDLVPLFIRVPNATQNGVVKTVGGQTDIAPTVLHLLGIDPPSNFMGRSLLPEQTKRVAPFPNGSAMDDKLIFVTHGRGVPKKGLCVDRKSHKSLSVSRCKHLKSKASLELQMSRRILDGDLHRRLAEPID